jgi:integrative and conjugative element protein (TIGR02256 family)
VIVWLNAYARSQIWDEIQKRPNVETGGALFGWSCDDGYVVACAGDPGARAKHRRAAFETDREHTQELIIRVHSESKGRCRFVGSWHTHPNGRPSPSSRDRKTAREISADPEVALLQPVLLIARVDNGASVSVKLESFWWSVAQQDLLPIVTVATELSESCGSVSEVHSPRNTSVALAVISSSVSASTSDSAEPDVEASVELFALRLVGKIAQRVRHVAIRLSEAGCLR